MYQALYRKYRPRTFDDVVGQEAITITLRNEILSGKTSHAYLFTGLRGSGKTTCSKLLAKAVNCPNSKDGNPCCECDICLGIDNDSITDVMEIDAASNSGVDYMRELREQAFYSPVRCKKRVYIIDETHMLSGEAFNALLKIMEEPPPHVLFILATTEVHKVPATIISRCQRFDFGRIAPESIAGRLQFIAGKEDFSIEHEAAMMIARLSGGGMRDAISLLDQCRSHSENIDVDTVAACGGLSKTDGLFDFSANLKASDCEHALLSLAELIDSSNDIQRLCEQLISHYRNILLARCTDKLENLIVCLEDELTRYKAEAKDYPLSALLDTLSTLQDSHSKMGRIADKRVILEAAVVKICSGSASDVSTAAAPDRALLSRIDKLEKAVLELNSRPRQQSPVPSSTSGGRKSSTSAADEQHSAAPAEPPKARSPQGSKTAAPFPQWSDVLEKLGAKNKALHGALVGSVAYRSDDLILIDSKNELFLKLIRENEYAKENLRDCIYEITGATCRLGPYRSGLYSVSEAANDPLKDILQAAGELGIDVSVTGQDE